MGVGCQLGDIVQVQFAYQVGAVFFHRFDADVQKIGDILVGVPFSQETSKPRAPVV